MGPKKLWVISLRLLNADDAMSSPQCGTGRFLAVEGVVPGGAVNGIPIRRMWRCGRISMYRNNKQSWW